MYYLGIDTSNKFIIISIFSEQEVLYFLKEEGNRKASELVTEYINLALTKLDLTVEDLSGIVVTKGPGSFTGVRIGLSVAKVLSMILDIELFTVSSLQYYSGLSSSSVVLDARSKKAYYGRFNNGQIISENLVSVDDIIYSKNLRGDCSLFGQVDNFDNLEQNFIDLKEFWVKESYFDAVPFYLKSNL